ncbi:type 2 periplasmic-binding domain-containing protein [Elizabethkingia anophelis]|uniref:hypothetical protein n=1 Tax=Elizabethkingia anophelis TaxID=1117645 RepID=UPI0038922D15
MNLLSLVGHASLSHLNQNNSPSAEASLVKGYKRIPNLTYYLPENLDIDSILRGNPPNFRYKRDKFVDILNLIYELPSKKKKNIEEYGGYTPINKEILGSTIKDYRKYIDYLKDQNIVEESNYIVGVQSSGLRFSKKYRTKLKPVEITDWTLIKNRVYLRKSYNLETTQKLSFLKKWFDDLDVDVKEAKIYLDIEYQKDIEKISADKSILVYNSRLLPLEKLLAKEYLDFHVDNTAGRLHTPITQLKSELRKNLRWKGKTLVSVDISNSQPYLLQSLLDRKTYETCRMDERIKSINSIINTDELRDIISSISSKEDVVKFKEIVISGKFYEEFGKVLKENGEIDESYNVSDAEVKKIVKKIIFSTLFSKNRSIRHNNAIQLFKRIFPNVYKVLSFIKKEQHNTLAIILQNLEADIILHTVCNEINEKYPHIPLFTLHDSVISTEEHVDIVKNVILQTMNKFFSKEVSLKIERWE